MSLSSKILFAVLAVFVAGFFILQYATYRFIQRESEEELLQSAERIRAVLMATRRVYHHQFLESGLPLTDKTLGFLPAHALGLISKDIPHWEQSGFSFNNVSDVPRNADHQADAVEQTAIDYFKQHPQAQRLFVPFTDTKGRAFYHYARPIWVEPYCLSCHGAKASAPATIRAHYDSAYNYQVGNLRGIVSIKIPGVIVAQRVQHIFTMQFWWIFCSTALLLLVILLLIKRNVIGPIAKLSQGIESMGDSKTPVAQLEILPGEFSRIGHAFNQMVARIKQKEAALKESESKFRTLVEVAQDGVVQANQQGDVIFCNHAAELLFGYREDEMVGKPLANLIPSRYLPQRLSSGGLTLGRSAAYVGRISEVVGNHRLGHELQIEMSLSSWQQSGETYFVAVMRDITERKQAEEQIRTLVFYDPLTALPNRRLLLERLKTARINSARSGRYDALLMLDLDNFKMLNDTQGHSVGDRLLVEVAKRIQQMLPKQDTLARIGGDEFMILLEGLASEFSIAVTEATAIAQKVRAQLLQPFDIDQLLVGHMATVSIGVTIFCGDDISIDEMLTQVDMALNKAKSCGRNNIQFFDATIQQAISYRSHIEHALKQAIPKHELQLYYQPQVDSHGRMFGVEALLRWQNAQGELVSPEQFIPIAEESGIINEIGLWVLQQACRQLVSWQQSSPTQALHIAINVSARQFLRSNYVTEVLHELATSGARADRLKLELTESTVLQDVESAKQKILQLKASGVQFALDDFGTGYSSLAYLKQLPVDQVKIDRSFVKDVTDNPGDAAIVEAILGICRSLSLEVIAEGVETAAQRDFLLQHGCGHFQGFFFSRPLPITRLMATFFKNTN
ncbi:EAL domain-containing protein [Shewanella fodinae]|uniref:EAL domain-containing protein n=1 Tax=Shewanella fodinae TaxID=552357 RepID=UPI001675C310|nr:EAL domain-containing protein [Shewanella fodinae]MCL2906953.1 EAL domain-containing protein [Shewanella fodinae]GGZ05754.1 hypothetical protein GCM10007169_23070 [Shewanella fodinae]